MSRNASTPTPPTPRSQTAELQVVAHSETPHSTHTTQHGPAPKAPPQHERTIIPIGTLVIIGFLLLNIVFFWMLVLGVQQGRA